MTSAHTASTSGDHGDGGNKGRRRSSAIIGAAMERGLASISSRSSRKGSGIFDSFRLSRSSKSKRVFATSDGPGSRGETEPIVNRAAVGRLVVEVTDTGAGISKENQQKLFKEIVQFHPEKLQAGGGSGLGLWITKGIVDLHSGNISVHSEGEGCGATFRVEIPMMMNVNDNHFGHTVQSTPPPLDEPHTHNILESTDHDNNNLDSPLPVTTTTIVEPQPQPTTPTPTTTIDVNSTLITSESFSNAIIPPPMPLLTTGEYLPSPFTAHVSIQQSTESVQVLPVKPVYRLLLVDDSQLNRKMLSRVMVSEGHLCEEAEDGQQALERVAASPSPYDAILMDFMMPVMDGPSATKRIREMGYTGKIFGCTGNALQADIEIFKTAGANEVLLKPMQVHLFYMMMKEE